MFERRSLRLPITLGVIMIVLVVVVIVGWVILTVIGAFREADNAPFYWTLLSVGSVVLTAVLVGVVMYLTLTVKAINLNRRQSNFVDSVTHELKSPIASLKLYLQTLTRHDVHEKQRNDFHRSMLVDVERLDHLINQLLDVGRLDKRPEQSETEAVNLEDVIRTCVQAVCLRYRIDNSIVQLNLKPIHVQARPIDVDLIFRNLIDNALKYAGHPPQVCVDMDDPQNGMVMIRITDNGRGVPRGQRRRIFGRFVRLGWELERDKLGTGLGLYIVHTLVRQLRGQIRVRDPDVGPGSVFETRLPVVEPPLDAASHARNRNYRGRRVENWPAPVRSHLLIARDTPCQPNRTS